MHGLGRLRAPVRPAAAASRSAASDTDVTRTMEKVAGRARVLGAGQNPRAIPDKHKRRVLVYQRDMKYADKVSPPPHWDWTLQDCFLYKVGLWIRHAETRYLSSSFQPSAPLMTLTNLLFLL